MICAAAGKDRGYCPPIRRTSAVFQGTSSVKRCPALYSFPSRSRGPISHAARPGLSWKTIQEKAIRERKRYGNGIGFERSLPVNWTTGSRECQGGWDRSTRPAGPEGPRRRRRRHRRNRIRSPSCVRPHTASRVRNVSGPFRISPTCPMISVQGNACRSGQRLC